MGRIALEEDPMGPGSALMPLYVLQRYAVLWLVFRLWIQSGNPRISKPGKWVVCDVAIEITLAHEICWRRRERYVSVCLRES